MSRIKFTVEDSKVSEVLKVLLNSGIDIKDWEVNDHESKDTTYIPYPYYPYPYYTSYKEEKDTNWDPWKYIGKDPFYVKIGDEGFDYTGSRAMSDKVYQHQSTTDNKTHTCKPTITTTDSSIKKDSSASKSSTTVSMKSELDFPYYKET